MYSLYVAISNFSIMSWYLNFVYYNDKLYFRSILLLNLIWTEVPNINVAIYVIYVRTWSVIWYTNLSTLIELFSYVITVTRLKSSAGKTLPLIWNFTYIDRISFFLFVSFLILVYIVKTYLHLSFYLELILSTLLCSYLAGSETCLDLSTNHYRWQELVLKHYRYIRCNIFRSIFSGQLINKYFKNPQI